jgi:hypothetical protein
MPDLLWTEAKCFFDPDLMGTLPDVFVHDTSVADWQSLFDLIRERGWGCECREGENVVDLPSAASLSSRPAGEELMMVKVWPIPEVLAIFRLYTLDGSGIEFDVDLRELQGQDRLDLLCDFLAALGRKLGKAVLMHPEAASPTSPILGYLPDADRVVLLAEPW